METVTHFSGFIDEKKVQKSSISLALLFAKSVPTFAHIFCHNVDGFFRDDRNKAALACHASVSSLSEPPPGTTLGTLCLVSRSSLPL